MEAVRVTQTSDDVCLLASRCCQSCQSENEHHSTIIILAGLTDSQNEIDNFDNFDRSMAATSIIACLLYQNLTFLLPFCNHNKICFNKIWKELNKSIYLRCWILI